VQQPDRERLSVGAHLDVRVGPAAAQVTPPPVPVLVHVRGCPVVAARPLVDHAGRQHQDDRADCLLRTGLQPGRQLGLEGDQGDADRHQRARVADAPPCPEARGLARVTVLGCHQRGHRDQVVGVGRMSQPEQERHAERHQQRRAVEETGEQRVELLHRLEQEFEVHRESSL
jgi:hypothetical protein